MLTLFLITLYSMYLNDFSINLKDRNPTHIVFMLPIRLSDYRAVGLSIGSHIIKWWSKKIPSKYRFIEY